MKKKLLLFGLVFLLTLGSSVNDIQNPSEYFPILMKPVDLEKSIKVLAARAIETPGKIYYKDQHIYLNEKFKGIHVINNQDPENPKNIRFINIPGCTDIAIKNNSMLSNNATDLVSIDISNPNESLITARIKNVFPESTPPDLDYIPYMFSKSNRPKNTVIVGWKKNSTKN